MNYRIEFTVTAEEHLIEWVQIGTKENTEENYGFNRGIVFTSSNRDWSCGTTQGKLFWILEPTDFKGGTHDILY